MTEQPEALRLADELAIQNQYDFYKVCEEAAAELRRLHAENTEIRTLNDDLFYQGLAVINEKQELLDAAVKAEREACAKLAGPHLNGEIAAAIRARGEA